MQRLSQISGMNDDPLITTYPQGRVTIKRYCGVYDCATLAREEMGEVRTTSAKTYPYR